LEATLSGKMANVKYRPTIEQTGVYLNRDDEIVLRLWEIEG